MFLFGNCYLLVGERELHCKCIFMPKLTKQIVNVIIGKHVKKEGRVRLMSADITVA